MSGLFSAPSVTTQPFGLQDQMTSNQSQAVPLAYMAGTRLIAAKWFTPIYNLRSAPAPNPNGGKMSSKAGGSAQQVYYGSMAGAFCRGVVTDLLGIILNGSEVWPGGTPWSVGLNIIAGNLYVFDAQTWKCTTNHTATALNAPGSGLEGWTEYTFNRGTADHSTFSITDSSGVYYGTLTIYWGTPTQTTAPLLEAGGNDQGDAHPAYKNICYVTLDNFLLGQSVQSGPNLQIVVRRAPEQDVITGSPAGITDGQINLAAAAVEILTDPICVGQPDSVIDDDSFGAVATWLDTNEDICGASVLIDSSTTLREVMNQFTQMMDGYSRFNASTGCIELGVYQHGVTPTDYATLTDDDLAAPPEFEGSGWEMVKTRATVNLRDRQIAYQTSSQKSDDPRAYAACGEVREVVLDRPYICRAAQALLHGHETLREAGIPPETATVQVRRELARTIRAGDYVLLDVDIEPGVNSIYQFFRVTQRTIPPTGPITLKLLAENTLAPIPFANGSPSTLATDQSVPAITSFRFLEAPTVLTDVRGAVIPLVERPNNLIVGCQLYFDTNPSGTFSSLGTFTGFAAKATLNTALTAAAGTITVNVDTTQPEAGYLTNAYSANDAANDTFLAFIVSVVASGTDAGEVAESGGFQIVEICSISTMTLVSAGVYTLTALRGRQGTVATAFATANTEVWLIPRALLVGFVDAQFDQIRANRLAGLTPAYAQFRLCPYTFAAQLQLADATSEQFRFPLNSISVPTLTLTAPASFTPNYTGISAWPLVIPYTGTWADPDGLLVECTVELEATTDTSPRLISDQVFAPAFSKITQGSIQIEGPGTFTLTFTARDSANLTTTVAVVITVAGSASAKCAFPSFADANGNPILNAYTWATSPMPAMWKAGALTIAPAASIGTLMGSGAPDFAGNTSVVGNYIQIPQYNSNAKTQYWSICPNQNIPFDKLQMSCSTPGAVIYFYTTGPAMVNNQIVRTNQAVVYDGVANFPLNALTTTEWYVIYAWATAPGYTLSAPIVLLIQQAH